MSYSLRGPLSKALQAILTRGGGSLHFRSPATIRDPGTDSPVQNTRISGRVVLDAEVIISLSSMTKLYYITFMGQFVLHLWLVL